MDAGEGGSTVLAERDRPRTPESHRVDSVDIDQIERVDDVAERLRDLAVVEQQVPVDEQLSRGLVAGREQHRGPEDAVEAEDVLGEQMPDLGPERLDQVFAGPGVGERAEIVDEGVGPDVRHRVGIPRDRNPPGLSGAADREVLQAARDEASSLVGAEPRLNEVGSLVELEELLLEGRETEEPVALLDPLGLHAVLGTFPVDELRLGLEGFAADAIQPRVDVLIDVAVVVERLQKALDEALVRLVTRPDEEVVRRVETAGKLAPDDRDLVCVLLRRQALLGGDPRHFRGVLVDPGEEERLVASLAAVACQDVRRDRRVRMPDVRGRVDVVDRSRDVVALAARTGSSRLRRGGFAYLLARFARHLPNVASRASGSASRYPAGGTSSDRDG